jgi:signal transduction histidine kinase
MLAKGQDTFSEYKLDEVKDSIRVEKLNQKAFELATKDFKKALKVARKALAYSDSLNNKYLKAKAYDRLGVIYYYNTSYNLALQRYFKALSINEELKNKIGISRDLNNIGLVYAELKNYENALQYYHKSLQKHHELDYENGLANNYNNIGIVYRVKSEYDSALYYYTKALNLNKKLQDSTSLAHNYNNIGNLHKDQKNYLKAYSSYQKALQLNQQLGNKVEQAKNYFNLGYISIQEGSYTQAENYIKTGIKRNDDVHSLNLTSRYLREMINLRKAQEKIELLPALYEQYIAINDSLYSKDLNGERQKLSVVYELGQKNDKIQLLKVKNKAQAAKMEKEEAIQTSLFIISVLLIVILILVVNRYLIKSRMNRKLEHLVAERTADLEKAKEKAEESDRLKSSFLANMSHEIRTPMNAIAGFTEYLSGTNFEIPEEEKTEIVTHIHENSYSLIRLIDDIIDIAKIQADQIEINKRVCNVYEIAERIYSTYYKMSRKPVEFYLDVKEEEKTLKTYTDSQRVEQVLNNLTSNAFKFTEEGYIRIGYRLYQENGTSWILFYIEDTGIGISKTQQDVIFKRFGKAENRKEKLYRGAGLGLSISKHIVELLDGTLWVDSELNKGSVFYFTLPY